MTRYLTEHGTRRTDQAERIPGRGDQVENSAGGYAWAVDNWARLRRFLILGSEGGSYYAGQRELTTENVDALLACIREDGPTTVSLIVDVSTNGRAPKNDPAIFALAACAGDDDADTRAAALSVLSHVCRTGTHLFQFCTYVEQFRGWGPSLRKAVAKWYTDKEPARLAYQLVKYRQREGWTHRDVLRLAHPKVESTLANALLGWATGDELGGALPVELQLIEGYMRAQEAMTPKQTAALIAEYNLPREAVNPEHLTEPVVWDALLRNDMPMTALVRNLGNMTKIGLLTPTSEATGIVLGQLGSHERIREARVHPINVLAAMRTYAAGQGYRGAGEWNPVPKIVDALDAAFYGAFGNVEPTNKRILFGLDVSGSMNHPLGGIPFLTCREGSAAMALVTAAVESLYECVCFTGNGLNRFGGTALTPYPLSARQRLDDVVNETARMPFGGTDCALPMLYAIREAREVDTFIIYTDSETWAGNVHPSQALAEYRRASGIPARLVVVGMVSNGFTIADPTDAGMLDVVGFDTATPQVISEFARGAV